ncbi:hypothetical protein [Sphingosinicella sp. YJ22]|uniref:hypothetical protein n=1 Tax=Sphingosinicella sp. YJ22 TaxID=1104780 RepID=UPI0014094492|nr:hypothetical protein [Sphingosinicella sp. YJ22]
MLDLDILEVSGVGWFGIFLGFGAVMMMWRREEGVARIGLMFFLAITQVITAVYFYQWALSNTTDAVTYYADPYSWYSRDGFGLNTTFIIWLVQTMKWWFGGTYLDYFLLFQATGTWGCAFLLLTYDDVFKMADRPPSRPLYLTLFMPGIHFWTAYIGKDGLLFLAAAITIWAAVNIRARWLAFGFAVVIMILVRPHIALLAVAALAIGIALDSHTRALTRISLIGLSLAGLAFAAATIQDTFRIDVTSTDSVANFLEAYSANTARMSGTTSVQYDSFFARLFSLLFRPLFFDAGGFLGLVASMENLFILIMVTIIVLRITWVIKLFRHVFLIRFAVLFAVALTIMLSLMYYNVGLGLRQKLMMMPAYLTIFAAVVASAQRVRIAKRQARLQPA